MNDKTPKNQINLFNVLLYEIGHALGSSHSNDADSIMYAFYDDKKLESQADDILAMQSLYGTPSPQVTPPTKPKNSKPKLCDLDNINTFLIVNQLMYIFTNNGFGQLILEKRLTLSLNLSLTGY
jgi:hypothetical protein